MSGKVLFLMISLDIGFWIQVKDVRQYSIGTFVSPSPTHKKKPQNNYILCKLSRLRQKKRKRQLSQQCKRNLNQESNSYLPWRFRAPRHNLTSQHHSLRWLTLLRASENLLQMTIYQRLRLTLYLRWGYVCQTQRIKFFKVQILT